MIGKVNTFNMQQWRTSWLIPLYVVLLVLLFFYSFTQIDLGLALTRFPFLFSIQRSFQYIGYFNRPLSTVLYSSLFLLLFFVYGALLLQVHKKKLAIQTIWKLVFVTTAILVFSYNAFSYDLFNYIFDAKIFTFYGKNPYAYKALDFPTDPMLGFMHWTHRVYPYGPIWLLLTIPLSYLGMHVFLLTFFLFKLLIAASYLGTIYYISNITKKLFPSQQSFAVAFFACNPFILIETLISGHNDIVMLFFAIASLYFLIQRKYWWAFSLFFLSVGLKFATIFLLPVYLAIVTMQYMKEKIPWIAFLATIAGCMSLAVLAASHQSGNFQPWYLLFVLPYLALLSSKYIATILTFIASIAGVLTYVPFLYYGHWDPPVRAILSGIYVTGCIVGVVFSILYYLLFVRYRKAA